MRKSYEPETQIKYEVYKHVAGNFNKDEVINYVVYSHSSFLDVLQIQTDHLEGKGNLTLLINKNDQDLDFIYDRYDKVVFYDGRLNYARKLSSCISVLEHDYFVLIHDNDILIHSDDETLKEFVHFLRSNDFDRIDFQLAYDYDLSHKINDDSLFLIKSNNTDTLNKGYTYNVNPSIWKRDTLLDILTTYIDRDYRNIETDDVHEYCQKYNIFKLFANRKYNCGYFVCLEPFRYLHITHSQMLFSPKSIPEEMSKDIIDDYYRIVDKYNLRSSNKWIG